MHRAVWSIIKFAIQNMAMRGRFPMLICAYVVGTFSGCLITVYFNDSYKTPAAVSLQLHKEEQLNGTFISSSTSVPTEDGRVLVLNSSADPVATRDGRVLDVLNSSADPKHCVDASSSQMTLTNQQSEFQIGETILVTIRLFDSYKQRKIRGGDFIHVWIKEESKNACAAGVITDNNDGSYTGTLKALWTGSPRIEAFVVGSRETMEIHNRIFRDHLSFRNITAQFECDGIKEETLCQPLPVIPGFEHVCDLTDENYGLPWYCGKPSHRKLLCQDFVGLRDYHPGPLTDHEKRFFKRRQDNLLISGQKNLPPTIQVTVKPGINEIVGLPTIPCNKSPLRQSWEASTPIGFFYKNQWKSLTCNNTIPPDSEVYSKCLKDRTLWLHGDSTSRQWVVVFQQLLGMELVTESWDHTKWHKPAVMRNEQWNITVKMVPHEYPFFHGFTFTKLAYNRATHVYLDQLPNDTRDIFVIHAYHHFEPFPPDVYRTHIKRIVKSVGSLLSRAPGVKVAVRGPHAYKSSIWLFVYDRILREEFKGYEDRVLFLNNIDLTLPIKVEDLHPTGLAVNSLTNHFMGYVCS